MNRRILITGASGLVGAALHARLAARGDQVFTLGRGVGADIQWNVNRGTLEAKTVAGFDIVIHLAGENIASGRWNATRKHRIHSSRVDGTRLLCERLLASGSPPPVFIQASATGYYGERGEERLTESSPPPEHTGFLPQLCREWEAASALLQDRPGTRTAQIRIGMVLTPDGGALKKMLTPFRLGVGGRLGHGNQYVSWISLPDLVRVFEGAIDDDDYTGPINGTAPHPVTNREFTKTLGTVLRRPTFLPTPAFALRLALGEMADALLLTSTRAEPARLADLGFEFEHADLETALRAVLQREELG